MIILDSSAVLAMLFDEPEASACSSAMDATPYRLISAVNYVEAGTVLAARTTEKERDQAIADLDAFLDCFRIEIASLDADLAREALKARVRFGKGFGVRKGLNFGDCFAYALARQHNAPLLFVGNDFGQTDIQSAL